MMIADFVPAYQLAKQTVIFEGYGGEVKWQEEVRFEDTGEQDLLRELAWVILSSGMKEQVVRSIFGRISPFFYDWESAALIVANQSQCRKRSGMVFKNAMKIEAIIESAEIVHRKGLATIKEMIRNEPIQSLRMFPYVGPITAHHLAKNIGVPIAKPDRHLVRIALSAGYTDVQQFCHDLSRTTGDCIQVVDIVLWRFANLEPEYLAVLGATSNDRIQPHSMQSGFDEGGR